MVRFSQVFATSIAYSGELLNLCQVVSDDSGMLMLKVTVELCKRNKHIYHAVDLY